MKLTSLEEWSILFVTQEYLLANLAPVETGEVPESGSTIPVLDCFDFLRYELQKLPISIPGHKNLDEEVVSCFKASVYGFFTLIEKELVVCQSMVDPQTDLERFKKLWEAKRREGVRAECKFDSPERFPKLWELKWRHDARAADKPSLMSVVPDHTNNGAWSSILLAVTEFNKRMEALFWNRVEKPPLRREDYTSQDLKPPVLNKATVRAVLETLHQSLSLCPNMSEYHHQTLLEVVGRRWRAKSDSTCPVPLFLSAGCRKTGWQAVECSYINPGSTSNYPAPLHSDEACPDVSTTSRSDRAASLYPVPVPSLCLSIADSQSYRETLELSIHDGSVYQKPPPGKRNPPIPSGTLHALLHTNNLLPWSSGSVSSSTWTIQEKRELAVDLSLSFMFLFDFAWTDDSWTAHKIFLTLRHGRHAPYIECGHPDHKTPMSQTPHRPSSALTQSVFLALAQLLVEIETGKPLVPTSRTLRGEPNLWLTIVDLIEDPSAFQVCDEYHRAVEGCLELHRLVGRWTESEIRLDSTGKIYDAIVVNLEKELGHYQRSALKRRLNESFLGFRANGPSREPSGSDARNTSALLGYSDSEEIEAERQPRKRRDNKTSVTATERDSRFFGDHPRPPHTVTNGLVASPPAPGSSSHVQRPSHRRDFDIAIMCALEVEYAAVEDTVDEFWDENGDIYGKLPGDRNEYATGRIGTHNVVMVLLPEMGKTAASAAANNLRLTYESIEVVFLVGVCAAVPSHESRDVHLGDVVIGKAVVQHDLGRQYDDEFRVKDTADDRLGRADQRIRGLTKKLNTPRTKELLQKQMAVNLEQMQSKIATSGRSGEYDSPPTETDRLFRPDYRHRHRLRPSCKCSGSSHSPDLDPVCDGALRATCAELQCDKQEAVLRQRHGDGQLQPIIHIGRVASGDTVLKSGVMRDKMARELDVAAFEMEAAGIWDALPCLVVKGVCDYADSHKDKRWQAFAAATAASACKAILSRYGQSDKARQV